MQTSNAFHNLPVELIEEIFLAVSPVILITRCRAVSRTWKAIIETSPPIQQYSTTGLRPSISQTNLPLMITPMAIDVLDIFWKHLVHRTSDAKLDSLIDELDELQGTASPPSGPEREMFKAFKRYAILRITIANFTPILDRTLLTTNPQLSSVAFLAKTKYPYGRRICEDKLHMLRQHTQSTGPLTARFLVDVVAITLHHHIYRTAIYASEFSSYDGWPTRPRINLGVRYGFADRGWGRSYLGYRYIAVPSQVMLQVRFYEGKPFDGLNWRSPASVGVLHEVVILQRDRESVGPIAFRGVAPRVHVAGAEGIES